MGKGSGGCMERPALAPELVDETRGRRPAGAEDTFREKDIIGARGEVQVLKLIAAAVEDARGDWRLCQATSHVTAGDWALHITPPQSFTPHFVYAQHGASIVYARWSLVEGLMRGLKRGRDGSFVISASALLRVSGEPSEEVNEKALRQQIAMRFSAKAHGDEHADYDLQVPVPTDVSGSNAPGANLLYMLNVADSVTIEVKTDQKAYDTGNYYSEHERLTRPAHTRMKRALEAGHRLTADDFTDDDYEPSALMVSKAPHYAINSGDAGVIVPTAALKAHTLAHVGATTAGGDNLRSRACLMKLGDLLDFAASAERPPRYDYDEFGFRTDQDAYADGDYDPSSDYQGHPPDETWSNDDPAYSEAAVDEFIDFLDRHDL